MAETILIVKQSPRFLMCMALLTLFGWAVMSGLQYLNTTV
jgi:hypothetical protein